MANLILNAFENETYGFEDESGHNLKELTEETYSMTNDIDQDESASRARRHGSLQSSNSLAPLLPCESPDQNFNSTRLESIKMPQSDKVATQSPPTINDGLILNPPPIPHTKSHPRVFSKKGKLSSQGPVPIPGPRSRPAGLDFNMPLDAEGLEMSTRESVDSGQRSWSLESPSLPPEWCISGQFDVDSNQGEDQSCSYLKPLDSPMSEQPGSGTFAFTENHVSSPADSRREFTPPLRDCKEPGQNRRFDSGIGDSESEHGSTRRTRTASDAPSSTSASSSYPRLTRLSTHPEQHYEDIDAYRKYALQDTSEVPEKSRPANGSVSQGRSRLPTVNISGATHTESRDHVSTTTTQRHPKERPYHDPRTATLPHTYSHLENNGYMVGLKTVENTKTRNCCGCLVFVLILTFLMSAAALAMGVYLIINDDQESSTAASRVGASGLANGSGLAESLSVLELRIAELQRENTDLKADLDKIKTDVKNEVQPLYKEVSHLRITQRDTIQSMTAIDDRLTSGMANISLTPGPQGPVGVANFSLCVFKSIAQSAIVSNTLPTITPLLPDDTDVKDHVVLFAYCFMSGAQKVHLEVERSRKLTISGIRFKCVCSGMEAGQSMTRCVINAILCPKLQKGVPPVP